MQTELISQNGDSAEVHVIYDIEFLYSSGEPIYDTFAQTYYLVMVNDEWLINGDDSDNGITTSYEDEYEIEMNKVQLAVIDLMFANETFTVTPQTTWTNDLSGDIISGDPASMKYYLEGADSMLAYYQWDSNGTVYQCEDTSCPDPF